jgi:transposase
MSYLGLVPSVHSPGPKRRIGAITKAGDIHARTLRIEAIEAAYCGKLAAVDAVRIRTNQNH